MDDLDLGPEIQFQMPANIEVPIKHELPKTTLESLLQIKNEFDQKIAEATEKNDSGKKRRYQRQCKMFEDAIKATKEGKPFNYGELTVPPGFSQIPLRDGRPILNGGDSKPIQNRVSQNIAQPSHQTSAPKSNRTTEIYDNIEVDDDFLDQLEKEIDENDLDEADLDPEEEHFNQQIKAASSIIPKIDHLVPKQDPSGLMLNEQMDAFKPIQPRNSPKNPPKAIQPQQIQQRKSVADAPPLKRATVAPIQSKELTIILERQRLFKEAALKAKQEGNVNVALVYLRHAKGFETMIAAAENGLPLDMSNLPVPPQLENAMRKKQVSSISPPSKSVSRVSANIESIKLVNDDEPIAGDRNAVYKHLLEQLKEQIEIATENFKHFTSMGDISNANKFNKIARESIQDLEALRNANKLGEPVPLYHYEKSSYETIDCNSDLTDNDLEINIIRGINFSMPKDLKIDSMNTFCKFEFPYPPEEVQTDKTKVQNASCNPEYNQTFRIQIQRKQNKFMRIINRKELKIEVFIKGGLFRSDKLLATSSIKLQSLENTSTIHDAFDLLEGRRHTGGKLEIKIRIREPLLHKEIKKLENKWLIIDKFKSNTVASF